jgi:hypothetical protein
MNGINVDLIFFKSVDQMEQERAIYEAALVYIRMGFKILPQKRDVKGYIKNLGIDCATDSPDVIRHWFGPGGVYAGYNILGVCPDGIGVIDVDKHGNVNGFENAGLDLADMTGLRVITPGGGCHFYTSDKISFLKKIPGIDKKTACLLPPSVSNGVRYQWDTGGIPGSIPEKMLEALGGQKPKPKGEPIEYAGVAPEEFLKELLTYFDPGGPYDEWCNVGMALHDNDPGQGHLDIWIAWSENSEKFKLGECERRWDTFSADRNKKVSLAWMIYEARKRGRVNTASDTKYSGINQDAYETVMKMNEDYMVTTQGGNRIIQIDKDCAPASLGEFKGLVAANLPPIMVGERYVPAADYWLKSKYRRQGRMVMEYPGQEQLGDINKWQGMAVKPIPCEPSEIQFFLDHTLNVICNGNKEHYEFLLDLLAQKFQKPLDLIGIAVVLKGKEGSGKSSFGEIIRLIVGQRHAAKVSSRDHLLGPYAGGMADMIFVSGEEAIFSAHKGEAERLKALITESPIDWSDKNVKHWLQKNCLFLMFTANENWVIPAGQDSRRFLVLRVSDDYMKDDAYWAKFMPLMGKTNQNLPNNPEYLGRILYFFLSRKITHSLSRAMVTDELVEQRKLTNADSMEAAFVEWVRQTFIKANEDETMIEGATKDFQFPVVTFKGEQWIEAANLYTDFRRYYQRYHSKGRGIGTDGDFKNRLIDLGMVRQRVKKRLLKIGAGKYPGEPDSKVTITKRIRPDLLEEALAKQYPLFMELDDENAEED